MLLDGMGVASRNGIQSMLSLLPDDARLNQAASFLYSPGNRPAENQSVPLASNRTSRSGGYPFERSTARNSFSKAGSFCNRSRSFSFLLPLRALTLLAGRNNGFWLSGHARE